MKDLIKIYNLYEKIMRSYRGENTDWKARSKELDELYSKINNLKIRTSENSGFYNWIHRKLMQEIFEESKRVFLKSLGVN